MTVAVEALITGRVQGVYYRGWTEKEAVRRGLSGWVTNNFDGSVSALFIGPEGLVQQMLDACWQGPRAARVDAVQTQTLDHVPPADGFQILR